MYYDGISDQRDIGFLCWTDCYGSWKAIAGGTLSVLLFDIVVFG
jgi:hypothetical protein